MVLLGALIGEEVSLLSLYAQFFSLLFASPHFLLPPLCCSLPTSFPSPLPSLLVFLLFLFLFFSFTRFSFLPLLVKVPQIVKILSASSVENLSYLANILELAAVTFTSTYSYAKGFPFR